MRHLGYVADFDVDHGIPLWVAYSLTKDMVSHPVASRTDDFRPDPDVGPACPLPCTYAHSGFDRGHLAPAADMAWSPQAMSESFFMSNMTPQAPSFNRGIWSRIEKQVRTWASDYDTLYIVTGPLLDSNAQKLNPCPTSGTPVSVPSGFFKAILSKKPGQEKAIGFLLPNEGAKQPLQSFVAPVDWIEYNTHLDLFPELPDSIEDRIEAAFGFEDWVLTTPEISKINKPPKNVKPNQRGKEQ